MFHLMFILPVSVTFTLFFRIFSNHSYMKLDVFLEHVYTALHHSDPRLLYMEEYSLKVIFICVLL